MAADLLLIRHCRSEGQEPEAALTAEGVVQAERLAELLADAGITRIVSSPYRRAHESVEPLARRLGLAVTLDDRLVEHVLCTPPADDWEQKLRRSFDDLDLCFEGGESSRAALTRGVAAVGDAVRNSEGPVAVATHGKLLTLILGHFEDRFGFEEWRALTNPDVFRVSNADGRVWVERIRP